MRGKKEHSKKAQIQKLDKIIKANKVDKKIIQTVIDYALEEVKKIKKLVYNL